MRLSRPARIGAVAGAAALCGLPFAGSAQAAWFGYGTTVPAGTAAGTTAPSATTVTQDKLTPTSMTAGVAATASLAVHSSSCFTAKTVGVGLRDAAGANLDFPGNATNVRICPEGLAFTSAARTLPAGTYTQFGFWQDTANSWHNLPSRTLTVAPAGTAAPAPAPTPVAPTAPAPAPTTAAPTTAAPTTAAPTPLPPAPTAPSSTAAPSSPAAGSPIPGKALTWSEEFDSAIAYGSKWTGDKSSAYRYGNHNPDDNKLDWLSPSNVSVAGGVATFTAKPSAHTLENGKQAWDTGLLTTEYSSQGFQVKTGDYAETRVKLPAGTGAWPALWTWKNGGSEIDSFEYHPDNPNLLELTNHVKSGSKYYTDASAVAKDQWVTIGTYYGANSVDWYVNGKKVFSDGTGVGANWSAYLILNLSLSAGQYHPAAAGSAPITFAADYVRVYR
ncbi:glycoside hydrolase family 16 protein [Kitasatospora cinereorecta]|uniref:Glycoside hydrolase family 16 protein n=1 Tax=Kitasatospora cinereorecta TaxID=285560 RepID=A0ABW0VDD1_9ACTN